MPYTDPTPTTFKERFSAFAAVEDSVIEAVLVEAKRHVDQSWFEADYTIALNYLIAHFLVTEGALNDPDAAPVGVSSGQIVSESLGDASVTYANSGSAAAGDDGDFSTTVYGRRFLRIQRANQGGAVVV